MTTYSAPESPIIGGRFLQWDVAEVVPDGIWTWFSDPRAVYADGALYVGWVDSAGTCGISKRVESTGVTTHFSLSSIGLEIDDHNNTAIQIRTDGRIMAIYGKHNDQAGLRYRISTNPHDISAWGSEQNVSVTLPYTYSNPHLLNATGKVYCHYRSGVGGAGTNPMNSRVFNGSTWEVERTWITNTGARPYIKACNNGVDRIDFLLTNCHPNEGAASVYHCYMQLDAGVEKFYKSDGAYIGIGNVTPAQCSLIYDGSSVGGWVWDITYGADGHPRVLFTRYPSTTDHRYMYSRWTGGAWTTPAEITNAGTYLYAAEAYYSGGITFDGRDQNTVYLSKQVGAYWEIQEWRTDDAGVTWAKQRDVTSGSMVKNCRPYSPRGYTARGDVLFWSGTYTTYENYNTAIKQGRLR